MEKNGFVLPLFKASILSIVAIGIWYFFLWENAKKFPEDSEISASTAQSFLIFSAFLPTVVLVRMITEYDQLGKARRNNSSKEFIEIFFKKLPTGVYLAMIIFAILAIVAVTMMPYVRVDSGLLNVGGLTFIHAFLYFLAKNLDNPDINKMNLPKEWVQEIEKLKKLK